MYFERGLRTPHERTLRDIQGVLEAAGVLFVPADEHAGAGVRHRA